MPLVSPFTGLLFDAVRAGPLDAATAPPYDAITGEEQRRLHTASPYNVVRLILGMDEPGDDAVRNKYTRGAETLRRWREDGVLVPTPQPSWYPYEMRFAFQGSHRRIRGLICEVELEPWGGSILPHERTLPGPVADRLSVLRTIRANLSSIHALATGPCEPLAGLFDDVASRSPSFEVIDESGVEHRMWVVPGDAAPIDRWLRDDRLLIADGHHRYTVALAFREEMRATEGPGPWDRVMMLIVDAAIEDPPVLPIHRVLLEGRPSVEGERVRDLAEVLASLSDEKLTYGTVAIEDDEVIHHVTSLSGEPPTVSALHEQALPPGPLRYVPDAVLAEEAVRTGRGVAAYFLPPTKVERIRSVIDRGQRMPEKSTYFWPKPRTGSVIRPLRVGG